MKFNDLLQAAKYIFERLGGIETNTRNTLLSINNQPNRFLLDGVLTDVSQDTVTPDNSDPLPVTLLSSAVPDPVPSLISTHKSPNDFTATYTSNVTITLAGHPSITDASQIVYIKQIKADDTSAIYYNGAAGITMTYAANVITIHDAGTPFAAGDIYEVGINYQDKAYDKSLDIKKVIEQSPLWERYTDPESLLSSAYEITSSFADVGNEIDVRGYNYLILWCIIDIGTSTNVKIRILHKHTFAGSEEFREIYLGTPGSNITSINLNDYEIESDANQLFKLVVPVIGTHYVQIQAKDDSDGDGQIDALYVTKAWGV